MNRNKIARLIGILFIIQMAAAVSSYSIILEPILYSSDYLNALSSNANMVRLAMLLDLLCGAAVFGIAILFYPILKQTSERIALWYVGQRLTELVGFMISGLLLLTVLKISLQMGDVTETQATQLETTAYYLRNARGNVQNIALLVYCLGAWSLYGLLFYIRLIPRFISIWGLIAVTLLFIEILANVYDTTAGGMMIMMPLGLNEIFLGIWLIVKGFNREV
ncbi:DUF4386 domain-containing protein [Ekhidna sp.]|uniref:DUF4386 domain-containing protein n=1 Tax=Ekhidna sp. TaxID=2608089 RepID=UPI003297F527